MIPAAVSIDSSAAGTYQEYLAWVVLAIFVIGVIVAKVKLRYWTLDGEQRRHLRAIRPALASASWEKIPIRADEERGPRYQQVVRALDGDVSRARPRAALGRVRAGVSERLPAMPPLAIRAGVEGVLLLLFGVLLAVSREQWQALLVGSLDRTPTDPGALVDAVAWGMETTIPGGAELFTLAASVVLVAYTVLSQYWFVIGVALVLFALAVVELDRRTPTDLSPTLYPDRRELALRSAMWLGILWIVALVGQTLGELAAEPLLGYVLVGFAGATVGVVVLRTTIQRLRSIAGFETGDGRPHDPDALVAALTDAGVGIEHDPVAAAEHVAGRLDAADPSWREGAGGDCTTLAFVLVRQVVGMLIVVAAPLVVYFGVRAVGTGSILGPLLALGGVPWYVALLFVLAGLVAGVWALFAVPALAPLREWLRRRVATGTVRSAVMVRGIPTAAAVIGGLVGFAYLGGVSGATWYGTAGRLLLVMGVTAAIAVGVVVFIRWVWNRFGVTTLHAVEETYPPTDQVVEVLPEPIEDADGNPLYCARVDGRAFAARDADTLLRLIERVVDERFETGETPELVAHELYTAAADRGVVDLESVFRQVRGDLDTRIEAALVDHDREMDYDLLVEELEGEYPERLVEDVLRRKRERNDIGVSNGRVKLVGERFGGLGD